jgi:hypothetical protein
MSSSYTPSPPKRLRGVQWDSFSYSFKEIVCEGVCWILLHFRIRLSDGLCYCVDEFSCFLTRKFLGEILRLFLRRV